MSPSPSRSRLPLAGLLTLTLALAAACAAPAEDPRAAADVRAAGGEEALALLMEGNARFVAQRPRHSHEDAARRARLAAGQHPFAVVLGCADSRVPPELVFDAGLGDVFVVRVAGNVVARDEAGSIEYACEHLEVPLVLVLGHEGCGAVTAALQDHRAEVPELRQMLDALAPALADVDPSLPLGERVHLGVEANVRHSVERLEALLQQSDPMAQRTMVRGAVYELETGAVRLLD